MAHCVYILYSPSLDKYYVGETVDLNERLDQHLREEFRGSYTKVAKGWRIEWHLTCSDRSQARKIEQHIKRMKSRKYLENLCQNPEKGQALLQQYPHQ